MKINHAIQCLASAILNLRINHTPKQGAFAQAADIEPSHYSKAERGIFDMQMSTYFKICRALRLPPWVVMQMAIEPFLDFTEKDDTLWK